jgi:hypothetical protein
MTTRVLGRQITSRWPTIGDVAVRPAPTATDSHQFQDKTKR